MLIFDTETTGLIENMTTRFDKQPEVVEFAAIRINEKGKILEELDQLIKPSIPITEDITKLNGIDNDMLKDKLHFVGYASAIRDMIERSSMVIAHNAAFDVDMLNLEFKKLKMTRIAWPRIICTVEQTIHIKGYRLTLSDLHEYLFKKKFEGAHRARADVEALARCVVELRKRGEL